MSSTCTRSPGSDADVVHSHLPGDVGEHLVPVFQLDAEHGVRQRLDDRAFDQNRVVLGLGRSDHLQGWERDNGRSRRAKRAGADRKAYPIRPRPISGRKVTGRVRTSGPLSVIATVCSKWAAREPSAVTTVQPSSSSAVRGPARGHHRLDREHHALPQPQPPARRPVVRDVGLLVHRGADPVAHVLPHDREARGRRRRPRPRRRCRRAGCPRRPPRSRRRATPGSTSIRRCDRASIVADRDRDRGVGVPALDDRAAVDRDDVAVLEHARRRGCRARSPRWARCRRRRESRDSRGSSSAAPRRSSTSRAAASRSPVVAPGLAARAHASCISATTAPARRITAICCGVLRSDHRRGDPPVRRRFADDRSSATLTQSLEHVVAFADAVDAARASPGRR